MIVPPLAFNDELFDLSLKPLDKPIARQFGTLYLPLKRLRMFF
jgi:hypothetical protein